MTFDTYIQQELPHRVCVGVVGHMDIAETRILRAQVRSVLANLQKKHARITLLCLGARGADQLAADVAEELGIPVTGLSFPEYASSCPQVTEEFKENNRWLAANAENAAFTKLDVERRPFTDDIPDPDTVSKRDRDAAIDRALLRIHHAGSALVAGYSDYLIALWDGVDNGKTGGTAETVHMALHGQDLEGVPVSFSGRKKNIPDRESMRLLKRTWKDPKGLLYHIVSPRTKNPYPTGRFSDWNQPTAPYAGRCEVAVTCFPQQPRTGNGYRRFIQFMKEGSIYNDRLLNAGLPVFLVLVTVALGSFGFRDIRLAGAAGDTCVSGNDFFQAVNLLTLNSSHIDREEIPLLLEIARWTGLFFVINAFLIAFLLTSSQNRRIRLKVWYWNVTGKPYAIIAGLNDISHCLSTDLKRQNKRVVIIDNDPDVNRRLDMRKAGIPVYKADSFRMPALEQLFALRAGKVYFLHRDEVLNIRSLQELSRLESVTDKKSHTKQQRYVHVSNRHYKDFRCRTYPDTEVTETHVFHIYENIARRLLLEHPIHRFRPDTSAEVSEVFIFGFGEMAQQIALSCLRSAHYTNPKQTRITIFTQDHETKASEFYRKYPALWYDEQANPVYEHPFARKIRSAVFPETMLRFKELPLSDPAYFSDETIHRAIVSKHLLSMYFCLPHPMQSATYLHTILPKIHHLQATSLKAPSRCDIRLFCYNNLYDTPEARHTEHILNAKIPESPVIFFGDLLRECTENTITNRPDDILPQLINRWYAYDRPLHSDGKRRDPETLTAERERDWIDKKDRQGIRQEARRHWKELSVLHKESNRYAADHLWAKLWLMGTSYRKIVETCSDDEAFSEMVRQFTYGESDDRDLLIREIAMVEHRRWCAEKLLEGFLPAQDFDQQLDANPSDTLRQWNDKESGFKQRYQEQKLHIDLLPFADLYVSQYGEDELYHNEKEKDISMIEAIPWLLYHVHAETQARANVP